MKRLFLIIMLMMLVVAPLSMVSAFNPDEPGPHVMAELMPDSTEIFAATRIGADFIAELDAITTALYAKLPPSLAVDQPYTIDATARMALAEEGIDWDELVGLMGDYAAVGVEFVDGFNSGEDPLVIVILEITDQAEVESFFINNIVSSPDEMPERQVDGDTIVYSELSVTLKITPSYLVFTNHTDYSPNAVATPLSANPAFTGAVNNLVADRYSMLAYVSAATTQAMLNEGDMAALQQMGLNPTDAGALVAGGTILAGNTLTVDVAMQTAAPMPTSFVNLDFLSAMPGTTDTFIVATDLTNAYNSIIAAVGEAAVANGEDDPTAQIPLVFNFTGLDLEDEVLSWTTGGYGIFMGADLLAMIEEAMNSGTVSELNFDAGIVIEATDVALAQNAAAKLGNTITTLLANEDGVSVEQSEINGTPVTNIIVSAPLDPSAPPLEVEFVLTATEDFFFFGTRSAFDTVMSGDTLAANADFGKSSQYFLNNATSVSYANADGILMSSIIPLASSSMMAPMIFSLSDEMGSDTYAQITEALGAYDDILRSATVSTTVSDGGVVSLRATLSVNP